MVAVALVTALAMDLAYQARVGLQIAANGRDELLALAQARGAVNLSRLVLHFQSQLDTQASAAAGAAGQLGGAGGGRAGAMPRIQVWKLVPVDSMLVSNLFPTGVRGTDPAPGPAPAPAPARDGPASRGARCPRTMARRA